LIFYICSGEVGRLMPLLEEKDTPADEPPRTGRAVAGSGWSIRILQRMGPVSLGVSVPRQWTESFDLHAGSGVHLRSSADGSLRIRPITPEGSREHAILIDVPAGTVPEHLFRRLLGAYLAGSASFKVVEPGGISAETRGVVRTFVRRTIQPEIISEEGSVLELQDVSDASPVPLVKLLGRMGQLVVALQRDAGTSWARPTTARGPAWALRDDEVDRQAWFIERSASRLLHGDDDLPGIAEGGIGPLGCWSVARSLERIADHAVRMGEAGALLSDQAVPKAHLVFLQQFHEQALGHLDRVLEALAEESSARANELLDTGEALHETARTLSERLFPPTGVSPPLPASSVFALGRILESVDRTVAYAQDIAQVALDRGLPLNRAPTALPSPERRARAPSRATQTEKKAGGKKQK
jgi:phosphate uptake regulator